MVNFLLNQKGLSKTAIGELLGEPDEYYISILDEFVNALNFTAMDLVEALRSFLSKFRLPGEAQKIDRIISSFASGYVISVLIQFDFVQSCWGYLEQILTLKSGSNPKDQISFSTKDPSQLSRFVR